MTKKRKAIGISKSLLSKTEERETACTTTSSIVSSFMTSSVDKRYKGKPLNPGYSAPVSAIYTIIDGDKKVGERVVVKGSPLPPPPKSGQKYVIADRSRIGSVSSYFLSNPEKAREFIKEQKRQQKKKLSLTKE